MFIIITLLLTVLVSGIFGAVPAVVSPAGFPAATLPGPSGSGWPSGCSLCAPTTAPG